MSESTSGSEWVLDVGTAEFDTAVIARSHEVPVVVDFWAEWCGPCRALGPLLERAIAARAGEVLLAKIDVDAAPDLAEQFAVQSIPTVIAFRNGRAVDQFRGVLEEPDLRAFLDRLQPSAADRLAQEAAALEDTEPARAQALYREALAGEASHAVSLLGLARLHLARDEEAEADELLERLGPGGDHEEEIARLRAVARVRHAAAEFGDPEALEPRVAADPDNAELRYQLGCALAGRGEYESALEQLLRAAQSDKELAHARVREAMVSIFYVIGARSALADDYRSKLARALY